MERLAASIVSLFLLLNVPQSIASGAESKANTAAAEAEVAAQEHTAAHVQRRYVPRFIGKRKAAEEDKDSLLEKNEPSSLEEIFEELNNDPEFHLMDLPVDEINDKNELFDEDSGAVDLTDDDFQEVNEEGQLSDLSSQEIERRNVPYLIGKRYTPAFVGKRYTPSFVGKRYTPAFVGKRYTPAFVGKRYTPAFVGKRYTPAFVGKRYTPAFVGKRYTPAFVGKRHVPAFVGKRAQIPAFVGKRLIPEFVGKRAQIPAFIGKKSSSPPYFVGKRADDSIDDDEPLSLGKRDAAILPENHREIRETSGQEQSEHESGRHKRSVLEDQEPGYDYKRAWGRYVPWKIFPQFGIFQASPEKRFVAPEFIGRREDSISSLLNALKVLRYARNQPPRLANKRFEAPLFIGKRGSPSQVEYDVDMYRFLPQADVSPYQHSYPGKR